MPDAAPSFTGTTLQGTGQVGLYVQDQIRAGQWLVTIGGRQDWVGTDTNGRHQSDDRFSGRVGVTYLFDNGFPPYASWVQSFEEVSGTESPERGGKAFETSTGDQFEVGVTQPLTHGNIPHTHAIQKITPNKATA